MTRPWRRRAAPAVLCAALLAAGCGSTVQQTDQLAAGSGGSLQQSDGLAVPGAESTAGTDTLQGTGAAPAAGEAGQPAAAGPGGAPGTAGAAGGAQAPAAGGQTAAAGGGGPVGVGLLYLDGADRFASSLGIDGLSTGDAKAQAAAVVADVNARGGLGGRQVKLTSYGIRAGADPVAEHSAACTSLTEDAKVSYVISYMQLQGSFLACYAKRGVAVVDDASSLLDAEGEKYRASFAAPGDLLAGRAVRTLVDALWRTGWLTAGSTVGTLVYDTPDGRALEQQHLLPALAKYGLRPKVTARSSMNADGVSQQNGFVLQYRSAGVDRIIPAGASPLFLMTGAESQGYRPRYAVQSTFGPGFLEGSAPPRQLEGAAGIGWQPALDIGRGTKAGPVSENETRCLEVMKKTGQEGTGTTRAFQLHLCNTLYWLKAAADAVGVSPALVEQARGKLGTSYGPTNTFSSIADPARVDGAGSYRDLVYDGGCRCFQYAGGDRPVQ